MTNHFIAPRTILEGQQFASLAGQFYMLYFHKNTKVRFKRLRTV
jgi:hypothetical protein